MQGTARIIVLTNHLTRYLDKAQHREAFESSHSVVLALFASLGQYQKGGLRPGDEKREEVVRFIVPFYASSLISVRKMFCSLRFPL